MVPVGHRKSWKELNPKSNLGDITIVFDNNNSSSARYMQDSVTNKQPFPASAYASKSIPAVIDYVAQNKELREANARLKEFDSGSPDFKGGKAPAGKAGEGKTPAEKYRAALAAGQSAGIAP